MKGTVHKLGGTGALAADYRTGGQGLFATYSGTSRQYHGASEIKSALRGAGGPSAL